jgi:hypothetical protein
MLADEAMHLALASAGIYAFGLIAWRWYRGRAKRSDVERELTQESTVA